MSGKAIDLTGKTFGRLTVVSRAGSNERNNATWNCVCICGNTCIVVGTCLITKHTASCGCLQKDNRVTHGKHKTQEYSTWAAMKKRCTNPNSVDYHNYGGRGITVCKRWLDSFENFLEDMGERPNNNSQIDRINTNKGYSKKNCRWATPIENTRNRRNNIKITYKGETKTLSEWVTVLGIPRNTINNRILRGWSIVDTFEKPIQIQRR